MIKFGITRNIILGKDTKKTLGTFAAEHEKLYPEDKKGLSSTIRELLYLPIQISYIFERTLVDTLMMAPHGEVVVRSRHELDEVMSGKRFMDVIDEVYPIGNPLNGNSKGGVIVGVRVEPDLDYYLRRIVGCINREEKINTGDGLKSWREVIEEFPPEMKKWVLEVDGPTNISRISRGMINYSFQVIVSDVTLVDAIERTCPDVNQWSRRWFLKKVFGDMLLGRFITRIISMEKMAAQK